MGTLLVQRYTPAWVATGGQGSGERPATAVGDRPDLLSATAWDSGNLFAKGMKGRLLRYIPPVRRVPHIPIAVGPTRSGAVRLLESAGLPTSDLDERHFRNFFFMGTSTEPIGLVGLELCESCALLRSLVVAPPARESGAGTALVERAEAHARAVGVLDVYLLTTTAESFFAHRGYTRISRESAPETIRSTREFADVCPADSAFMVKHLPK
jgi:amino-acid N-acetyltransferase